MSRFTLTPAEPAEDLGCCEADHVNATVWLIVKVSSSNLISPKFYPELAGFTIQPCSLAMVEKDFSSQRRYEFYSSPS